METKLLLNEKETELYCNETEGELFRTHLRNRVRQQSIVNEEGDVWVIGCTGEPLEMYRGMSTRPTRRDTPSSMRPPSR